MLQHRTIEALLEFTFLALMWMVYVGLVPPAFTVAQSDSNALLDSNGNFLVQAVWLSLLVSSLLLSTAVRRMRGFSYSIPFLLLAPLAWCWFSITWSEFGSNSFRRVVALSIVAITAAYMARALGPVRVLKLCYAIFIAVLIGDWLAVIVLPGGVQTPDLQTSGAAWRGLQSHKNVAGPFCAVAAIIFLDHARRQGTWGRDLLLILLAIIFLWRTMSKSSMGFLPIAIGLGLLIEQFHFRPRFRVSATFALLTGAFVAYLLWGDTIQTFTQWIQDDPTAFTGRSQIWNALSDYIADHPWTGTGYGALWANGENSPLLPYGSGWIIDIAAADNGYFDLTAQTGFIGLSLAIICLILLPLVCLSSSLATVGPYRFVVSTIIAFFALDNFMETSVLQQFNPLWIFVVILLTILSDSIVMFSARLRRPPIPANTRG